MTEAEKSPEQSTTSNADARALLEEAEAEAAEAEALAAAARARARAARLRREALAEARAEAEADAEAAEAKTEAAELAGPDKRAPDAGEGVDDTVEHLGAETPAETVEADEPETRPGRRRRRLPSLSATLKVAAILLICAFAAASGYMVWQDHVATQREQR